MDPFETLTEEIDSLTATPDTTEAMAAVERYRLYVHLWCDLFYLRAAVLWCRNLPGRIKRKLCQ